MSRSRSFLCGYAPALADCRLRNVAVENLVPTHDATTLLRKMLRHVLRNPDLKFAGLGKTFLFHACLAFWALFPIDGRAFIAADVDYRGREEFAHIVKNVLKETDRLIVAHAEHVTMDAPIVCGRASLDSFGEARERRICAKRGAGVSGKLDLRNYTDVTLRSIGENLLNVLGGIVERTIHLGGHLRAPVLSRAIGILAAIKHRSMRRRTKAH